MRALPEILEDGSTSNLSGTLRFLLVELKQELEQLAGHIEQAEMLIERAAQQSEACQRLDAIPGDRPAHGHCSHRRDRQRREPFARAASSQPGLGWSPANTPPEASRSCSASASAATVICENCLFRVHVRFCKFRDKQCFRPEALAGRAVIAQPLQRRRRGTGQQAGTHGMGGTRQRRCLSASRAGQTRLVCRWRLAKDSLGNRMRDSHIRKPATTAEFMILPGLLANHEMAQRSNPALLQTRTRKKSFETA